LRAIAKLRSLSEVTDQLLRSDYSAEISKLPREEVDSVRLERIFLKTLVERYFTLARDARGKAREFIETFATRIEVENLKRILRAKHAKEKIEEHNLMPLGREYTLVNFPALMKAENIDEVASLLRETVYASIGERLDTYARTGLPTILESFLDVTYFGRVWEKLGRLPDRKDLEWLIGEEIDLRNLQLIFTLKMRDVAPRLIEELSIPIFYRLRNSIIRRLVQGGLDDAPGILAGTSYDSLADEILRKTKEPAANLEALIIRRLYQDASSALGNLFLEFGYVVSYLLVCEREAKDLVTITTALDLGISEDELQRRLVF